MGNISKYILFILITFFSRIAWSQQNTLIQGIVKESVSGKPIEGVAVKLSNTAISTLTDKDGIYKLNVPVLPIYKLVFRHTSYQAVSKNIRFNHMDSLAVITLSFKTNILDSVSVYAVAKPETLVGKPDYSIFDFDFYEDKLLLLTGKSLNKAEVHLSDYKGKTYSRFSLPRSAGPAQYFFHDYEGYTDLVCKDTIFRIEVLNTEMMVYSLGKNDFKTGIEPVSDTAGGKYYFKKGWDRYPEFSYNTLKKNDTLTELLKKITNEDLMKLYRLEYYYLPSRMQLEARRIAEQYKVEEQMIGALISGFTQSMYYEPLFAPLFILKDTICIFNHHNDHLYHYDKNNKLIDSVRISYHHPKNWKEWKKQLFVDEDENKVYAFFSKNGHHYLKEIDYQTGKEILTYKLKHHSAEKIKIKSGYVYYIYRPFDSTQEKFLYRERIF